MKMNNVAPNVELTYSINDNDNLKMHGGVMTHNPLNTNPIRMLYQRITMKKSCLI